MGHDQYYNGTRAASTCQGGRPWCPAAPPACARHQRESRDTRLTRQTVSKAARRDQLASEDGQALRRLHVPGPATCPRCAAPFGRVRIRRRAVAARDRSPTGGERRVKLHAAYGCVCPVLHRSTARARALCSGYVSRSRGKEPRAGSHRKLRAASGEPLALMTRLLMTGKY